MRTARILDLIMTLVNIFVLTISYVTGFITSSNMLLILATISSGVLLFELSKTNSDNEEMLEEEKARKLTFYKHHDGNRWVFFVSMRLVLCVGLLYSSARLMLSDTFTSKFNII